MFLMLALNLQLAQAGRQIKGEVSVDGEDLPFQQEVQLEKEYSLTLKSYTLNFTIFPAKDKDKFKLNYTLKEKNVFITIGTDTLTMSKAKRIYAKGEQGQPNTILTFHLNE